MHEKATQTQQKANVKLIITVNRESGRGIPPSLL